MIKNAVFFVFLSKKNTHKTHEIVKVAVINDNNNFAPSLFRSLCEFVGDCFGPWYFSSGAALPQKNTLVQNNYLRFHTMTSKKMVRSYYCLNHYLDSLGSKGLLQPTFGATLSLNNLRPHRICNFYTLSSGLGLKHRLSIQPTDMILSPKPLPNHELRFKLAARLP